MNEEELIKETADITEGLYNAYGSGTGVLFGIPSNLKPTVASIIKLVIKKKSEIDKAKVREAIDKLINSLDLEGSRRIPEVYARQKLALDFATVLKKELGLE